MPCLEYTWPCRLGGANVSRGEEKGHMRSERRSYLRQAVLVIEASVEVSGVTRAIAGTGSADTAVAVVDVALAVYELGSVCCARLGGLDVGVGTGVWLGNVTGVALVTGDVDDVGDAQIVENLGSRQARDLLLLEAHTQEVLRELDHSLVGGLVI